MSFHHDVSRPVSPARLESMGESAVRHRLEAIDRKRRPRHITTQMLESIPIPGRNGQVGVQAHPALPNATRRNRRLRVDTALPTIHRLDPVAKAPPTRALLGRGRWLSENGSRPP